MIAKRYRHRRGAGILEVIVCTGLVALMVVPLAGVIRASGQSVADANGDGSVQAQMRQGLRYLSKVIREGEVQQVQGTRLLVKMPSGRTATVRVRGGNLELQEGGQSIVLVENVRRVRFTQRRQQSGDQLRVGVEVRLVAPDPLRRRLIRVDSAVAIPPQV